MAHTEFYVEVFYILSVLLSLVFAPVIFILWRNARILREKKWAAPFANTFFVLAAIYSLLLANLIITVHASGTRWEILSHLLMPIIATGSGLTNFLFLLSAYHLAEPALDNQRLPPFTERMVGQARVKWAVLIILLLAGLIQLGADKDFVGDWASGWFTVPDAIFSTLALLSMGVVLYRNIRFRHDPFMARLALVSSIGYAIIYVLFVLGIIQKVIVSIWYVQDMDSASLADLFISAISLLPKVGLFFPGLSLMLSISGPVEGIDRLLKSITQEQKEYLETEGIVRSVCEELHLACVRLYIKLPGIKENRIALYTYSPSAKASRQEPQEFPYEGGTSYDEVMRSGKARCGRSLQLAELHGADLLPQLGRGLLRGRDRRRAIHRGRPGQFRTNRHVDFAGSRGLP